MSTRDGCSTDHPEDYGSWLKNYLSRLSPDIDVDVMSDYITGILDCVDCPNAELVSEVESLISEYLGNEVCHTSAVEIVQQFSQTANKGDHNTESDQDALLTIEARMRALVQADYEQHQAHIPEKQTAEMQPRDRDVCTTAVLRECGAAGYQGDSEEEKEAEIAITNAEFEAKQRIELASGKITDTKTWSTTVSDEEIDLDELEDAIGYSKKDGAKPGTVQDALSILNPSLFGSAGVPQTPLVVGSSIPGSRPGRSILTGSSASVTVVNLPRNQDEESQASNRAERKKKKAPTISKHLARVGAQAEAKQSTRNGDNLSIGARNRVDQMDAFLSSDSDNESAPLPDGGLNRERVIQAELTARQNQANACAQRRLEEKANRAKQLEESAKRKEAAQKRAQKQERRR